MSFIVIDDWLHRDGNYGHTSREGKGMYETMAEMGELSCFFPTGPKLLQ